MKRVVVVLLVTAMVVITFGVTLGFLGVSLVFPCSDEERAVFNEFPHYGTVEPEVRPDTEIGGCAVFYDTDDSQGRVAEYYLGQLKAHGWKAEKDVSETWEPTGGSIEKPEKTFPSISIEAQRGHFYYGVFFESHESDDPEAGAHVAVHLSND